DVRKVLLPPTHLPAPRRDRPARDDPRPSRRDGMSPAAPASPLVALDTLWFQVAGTLCNLPCTHCFISSSPTNHSHAMMTLADVRPYLAEAEALGVKEYYLTG